MKTQKIKNTLFYIPEIIILLVAVYWFLDGLLGASYVNYFMLGIIIYVSLMTILKNKTMVYFASAAIGLGSFYMILAVISEYNDFPAGDTNGHKLLLTGGSIFASTLIMSIILALKYFIKKGQHYD